MATRIIYQMHLFFFIQNFEANFVFFIQLSFSGRDNFFIRAHFSKLFWLFREYTIVGFELHKHDTIKRRKPLLIQVLIWMLFFVVNIGQVVRLLKINVIVQFVLCLSEVASSWHKLLEEVEVHKLVNNGVEDSAPNSSVAARHFLDSLLWPANR